VREYKDLIVPERDKVPVPPYPGARIAAASTKITTFVDNKVAPCLPFIKLFSTDPVGKVVDFYKRELKDYKYQDMVLLHSFWAGRDKPTFATSDGCQFPNVSVSKTGLPISSIMPEAQTLIQIYYKPK